MYLQCTRSENWVLSPVTAVDVQPRVPLRRIDGFKGAVRRDRSLRMRRYLDRVNHKFGAQKRREERGVSSGCDTASESGLDSLPDYDEVEASINPVPGGPLAGERPPALR